MTATLAVSICNASMPDRAVGLYDPEGRRFAWLPVPEGPPAMGATGLHWAGDHLFVAYQAPGGRTLLAAHGSDLRPRHGKVLETARDVHSLLWHQGRLLFCDTGHDRVGAVGFDRGRGFGREETVWRFAGAPDGAEPDRVHLNALAAVGDALYVSLFGPRSGSWLDADGGMILDIATNRPLMRNLYHPHSLVAAGESLYFLESRRGLLHRVDLDGNHTLVGGAKGSYLRGLAVADQRFVVGGSAARRRSRRSGTVNVPQDVPFATDAYLWLIDGGGGVIRRDLFTPFGAEIYDLIPLPAGVGGDRAPERAPAAAAHGLRYEEVLPG